MPHCGNLTKRCRKMAKFKSRRARSKGKEGPKTDGLFTGLSPYFAGSGWRSPYVNLEDLPSLSVVITDVVEAARFDTEGAVIIKRGSRDATEDSKDREVMAYHHDSFIGGVGACNPLHPFPNPLFHVNESFSSWDDQLCRFAPPPRKKIRIKGANVGEGQPLEFSMIEFAKIAIHSHVKVMRLPNDLGSVQRPFQITGIDRVDLFRAEMRGDIHCLPLSPVVKIQVCDALTTSLKIPIGFAVPEKQDPHPLGPLDKFLYPEHQLFSRKRELTATRALALRLSTNFCTALCLFSARACA